MRNKPGHASGGAPARTGPRAAPRQASRAVRGAVLAGGLAVLAGSVLWLVLTGATEVRYSADHDGTVPVWDRWLPALAGIALVRLLPRHAGPAPPPGAQAPSPAGERAARVEAVLLLGAAVLFAVGLWLAGGGEPAHTLLKLTLLLAAPLVIFTVSRRRGVHHGPGRPAARPWWRVAPAVPVLAWLALSYTGPLAAPASDYAFTVDAVTLAATVAVVFVLNSLIEELFYRRWLQGRCEALLGPWPAIVLASLLWSVWHVGIQGSGDLWSDLPAVIAGHGVQGLFLGYLWSRYRVLWPVLVVHGAINAAPVLLPLLW